MRECQSKKGTFFEVANESEARAKRGECGIVTPLVGVGDAKNPTDLFGFGDFALAMETSIQEKIWGCGDLSHLGTVILRTEIS